MIKYISNKFYNFLDGLSKGVTLLYQTLLYMFKPPIDVKNIIDQLFEIGARSFPVTTLTSFSVGMVLALQSGSSAISVLNEPLYVGTIVAFSIVKELGPVLAAVVVTGRVGAAITAEIGTMKVTEQIDALRTLGTNPIKYLAVPRFISLVIMLPLLTAVSNVISILGGFIVGVYKLDIPSTIYWADTLDFMDIEDLFHGLIKSVCFAMIIALVSCHKGFECHGGAEGVGRATTSSVVTVLVLILVSDYFLSAILVAMGIG